MSDYDRSLLFSSLVEVVCCDVICVPLSSVNGKLFFMGLIFFVVCGVLFDVLSKSVFSFFRRRSLDETVLQSVAV